MKKQKAKDPEWLEFLKEEQSWRFIHKDVLVDALAYLYNEIENKKVCMSCYSGLSKRQIKNLDEYEYKQYLQDKQWLKIAPKYFKQGIKELRKQFKAREKFYFNNGAQKVFDALMKLPDEVFLIFVKGTL